MSDDMDFYSLFDQKPTPPATTLTSPVEPGRATRYASAALQEEAAEVAGSPDGTRNARLNKAWFNMGRHVGAGSIDAGTVKAALEAAGQVCGLPQHEIDTILRDGPTSGLNAGTALPRHPAPRPDVPAPTVLPEMPERAFNVGQTLDIAALVRERFPLIDWHELWGTEDEEEDWIVEPIIPARRLVALFSPPKVGKSLLMLELAVGIARGSEVLGCIPDRPRRVLYVDFENDPRGDVRTRLQAMGVKPGELGDLCYLSYPTLAKLDTIAGAAELMAIVAEYRCELVVIDTISRAVAGEENDNDTWLSFYRNTGLAMKQAGVACIRLDHTGKDHEKGMRGGSAKYGDVDAVWKLSRVTEEVYRLDCSDHRMRLTETEITLTRKANPLRHVVAGDARATAWGAEVEALVVAMDAAGIPLSASRRAVQGVLRPLGHRASNAAWARAVTARKARSGLHFESEDTPL